MRTGIYLILILATQWSQANDIGFINLNTESTPDRVVREKSEERYPSVGLITYSYEPICSTFILRHGLLATAKHCFQHKDLTPNTVDLAAISISFPTNGKINAEADGLATFSKQNLKIKPLKLLFDSGDNDIAYLTYNAKETIDKISLENFNINYSDDNPKARPLEIIGFPVPLPYTITQVTINRMISNNCNETKQTGKLPSKDKGYDGLLIGTNCAAWAGNSGGPIFALPEKSSENKILLGVLTHTFHVMPDGTLDMKKIMSDDYSYYMEGNYSPFSSALDLKLLMND